MAIPLVSNKEKNRYYNMNIKENTLVFRLGNNDNIVKNDTKSKIKHFIADLDGLDLNLVNKIKDKLLYLLKASIKKMVHL